MHINAYVESRKMVQMNPLAKQNRDTHREQTYGHQVGKGGVG